MADVGEHPLRAVVPFNSVFTRHRHDVHLDALKGSAKLGKWFCDCLHLCYRPPLWRAVFGELRRLGELPREAGADAECQRARARRL